MKRLPGIIITALLVVLCFNCAGITAAAAENEELFLQQSRASGADSLYSSLPEKTRDMLSEMGISCADPEQLAQLSPQDVLSQILRIIAECKTSPLGAGAVCIGIILICALAEGMNTGLVRMPLASVSTTVAALCVSTAAVIPVSALISRSAELINGASGFMLLYVPVIAGLLASGGQQSAAASYYCTLTGVGELITQLSSKLIVPVMNVFLALSLTAALSPRLRLSAFCTALKKCTDRILVFSMTIFTTVLSAQTLITSSLDNVSKRTLRFAVSSFVPVVGGVLSESLGAFSGSLELLRSGAGVFVIIASGCIFLPVVTECILWQLSLFILGSISEMLGIDSMKGMFASINAVVQTLTAVLLCILTVFIISTVAVLMIGRAS